MHTAGKILTLFALLALLAFAPAAGANEVRTVRVQFGSGASGAILHGHVAGHGTVHYLLGVRAGQMMRVGLETRSSAAHFNVFEPGHLPRRDAALYIGETGGNQMEVRTSHNGDYLIQVFLNRAAARRNEQADYTLEVSVSGSAAVAPPSRPGDATVSGTEFNATGNIPCARHAGQPMMQCKFGVVRRHGSGNGQVTVFWPDGGNRVIFFEDNKPVRFDQSQADGNARMTVDREADLFFVRIGTQRFEIPSVVMTGG